MQITSLVNQESYINSLVACVAAVFSVAVINHLLSIISLETPWWLFWTIVGGLIWAILVCISIVPAWLLFIRTPLRMISAGIDRSLGTLLVIMFLGSFVIDTVVGSNPATPNFAFVSIYSLWDKLWLALDPVRPPLVTVCLASLIITVTCLPDIARNDRRHGSVGSAWVGILVAALAFTWLQKLLQLQYFVFLSSKAVFPLQIASWVLVAAVVTSSIWLIYTSWSEPST